MLIVQVGQNSCETQVKQGDLSEKGCFPISQLVQNNKIKYALCAFDVLFVCAPLRHKAGAYKTLFRSAVFQLWEVAVWRPSSNAADWAASTTRKDQKLSSLYSYNAT